MPKIVKRLLILVGALAVLVGGAMFLAPSLVSEEKALASLRQGMDAAGLTLEAGTGAQVQMGATLHVAVNGANIKPKNDAQGWQAQVKQLHLELPLTALFGDATPSAVTLEGVEVRLTQPAATGAADPLPLQIVSGLANLGRPGFDLTLREGTLRQGTTQDAPVLIEHIEGSWSDGRGSTELDVTGQYHAQPMKLSAKVEGLNAPQRTIDYKLEIPGLTFGFQGIRSAETPPLVQGDLQLSSEDAAKVKQFFSAAPHVAEAPAEPAEAATPPPAPTAGDAPKTPAKPASINFAGKLFLQGEQFVLKEIDASAPGLKAKGELGGITTAPYNIQANLQFPLLDTDALETAGGMSAGGWLPTLLSVALTSKTTGKVLLRADKVQGMVQGEQFISLIGFEDGAARLQQTRMQVAGGAVLGFEGGLTMTPQGPTLIGRVSAEGESFRAFLPAITPMPMALPDRGFETFALAGDLRLSAEDLRLSDMRAKIGRSVWNMAFIDQFETHEVGVRIAASELDLDALMNMQASGDSMRLLQKRGQGQNEVTQARLLPPYLQEKLLGLGANYNLYLYLENYTLDGTVREPVEMRMRINRGKIDLDQLTTHVAGADVSVKGNLDINSSVPKLDLDMQLGDFDVGRIQKWFQPTDAAAAPKGDASPESPQGTRWSNAPLDWHFVPLAEGNINLTANRILHPLATASNAKVKAHLLNEQLIVDEATATLFNADLRAKGAISTGALPAWQLSFTLANLEIAEIGRVLPYMKDIQGRISFSGAIATNGISQLSQARNARGSLAMSGRAVQINQFDLSGMVDTMRNLNSVDNLKNEIDKRLPLGNTKFDSLEGNITLDASKITIPRILMRNARFVGIMDGEGSLLDWTMATKTSFPLSVIRQQNPPELVMRSSGPIDAMATQRDDRDLEKFVSSKTANDLIQGR